MGVGYTHTYPLPYIDTESECVRITIVCVFRQLYCSSLHVCPHVIDLYSDTVERTVDPTHKHPPAPLIYNYSKHRAALLRRSVEICPWQEGYCDARGLVSTPGFK